MSVSKANGDAGERFVRKLLEQEGWAVVNLAPAFPCDLLAFRDGPIASTGRPTHEHLWVEVKANRESRYVPPTDEEIKFLAGRSAKGDRIGIYWLLNRAGFLKVIRVQRSDRP